jgi:hypothetical protein
MSKRNLLLLVAFTLLFSAGASAAKQKGTASLKDLQPAGITDKKNKTQQFDFTFDALGNEYTCRTKDKLKAVDFPVGNDVTYEIDNDKAKLKNASGKQAKCTIVRVEKMGAGPAAAPAPK